MQLVESFAEQAAVVLEYARLQRLVRLEDRERIAKELHDGAIQALFAVGMSLQGAALLVDNQGGSGLDSARRRGAGPGHRGSAQLHLRVAAGDLADRQLDQALERLVD